MTRSFLFLLPSFLLATSPALAAGFSFADLRALIERDASIRSVDDAVAKLSEDHRRNFVLMPESKSRQVSSYAAPRVISFGGRNTDLIVAFQGAAKIDGTDVSATDDLETIEFDRRTSRYVFRVISFPAATGTGSERFQVSENNPALCLACHRDTPRPNWRAYPTWPGAYAPLAGFNSSPREQSEQFDAFLKSASGSPRYRALYFAERRMGERTRSPAPDAPLDGFWYLRNADGMASPLDEANVSFTNNLADRNALMVHSLLLATPEYSRYRIAIHAALGGCPDVEGFVPESRRRSNHAVAQADLLRELSEEVVRNRTLKFLGEREIVALSGIRWLLEPRGVRVQDWMGTFEREGYEYVGLGRRFSAGVMEVALRQSNAADLRDVSAPGSKGSPGWCSTLRERSLKLFAQP